MYSTRACGDTVLALVIYNTAYVFKSGENFFRVFRDGAGQRDFRQCSVHLDLQRAGIGGHGWVRCRKLPEKDADALLD